MLTMEKIFGLAIAVIALGCGVDSGNDVNPGTDADTDADTDTDTDTDIDTDTDADSDADGGDTDTDQICDEQTIPIWNDPVRVMILMDHSSSMSGGN